MRPEATISGSGKAQLTWRKAKFLGLAEHISVYSPQLGQSSTTVSLQPSAQFHSCFSTPDLYTLTGRLWLMLYFPVFIPRFLVSNSVCSVTDLVNLLGFCEFHEYIFRLLKKCGLKFCGPSIVDFVHKRFLPTHDAICVLQLGPVSAFCGKQKILNQPVWICSK